MENWGLLLVSGEVVKASVWVAEVYWKVVGSANEYCLMTLIA
jgi:hypothetical protein